METTLGYKGFIPSNHNDEHFEMRLRGGLPRGNAVRYLQDQHDVIFIEMMQKQRTGHDVNAAVGQREPSAVRHDTPDHTVVPLSGAAQREREPNIARRARRARRT